MLDHQGPARGTRAQILLKASRSGKTKNMDCISIDWFKGKITGKSDDLHGKIGLVSGEDFPLNQSFDQPFRKKKVVRWFPQVSLPRTEDPRCDDTEAYQYHEVQVVWIACVFLSCLSSGPIVPLTWCIFDLVNIWGWNEGCIEIIE